MSFCCLHAVSSVSSLRRPPLHCGPGDLRLLVLRPSSRCVVRYNCWSLDVRQLCHTSPSPITFHSANAFYWSTSAFKHFTLLWWRSYGDINGRMNIKNMITTTIPKPQKQMFTWRNGVLLMGLSISFQSDIFFENKATLLWFLFE